MSATPAMPAAPPRRRRRRSALQRRQTVLAWILLIPALAVVAFVAFYPLGKTVYYSFTDQQFLAGLQPTKWLGFKNYFGANGLIHDTDFKNSIVEYVLLRVL
jgi:trehalose/maltose transport system permease protein